MIQHEFEELLEQFSQDELNEKSTVKGQFTSYITRRMEWHAIRYAAKNRPNVSVISLDQAPRHLTDIDAEQMLHTGAITSTQMERKSGKAAEVLGKASLQKGDTIIISSNTGINTVPVEAALYAKQKGLTVVCVTSKTISEQLKPRSAIGKHLCDVSDIVIDNHAPFGDGVFTVPGTNQVTGGASTFGSLFIAQRIVLKIENLYLKNGEIPPILRSANIPGGDEFNAKAVALYRTRIPALS